MQENAETQYINRKHIILLWSLQLSDFPMLISEGLVVGIWAVKLVMVWVDEGCQIIENSNGLEVEFLFPEFGA